MEKSLAYVNRRKYFWLKLKDGGVAVLLLVQLL